MAFSLNGTWGGLKHIAIGIDRQLFRKPTDVYVQRFSNHCPSVRVARDTDGEPYVCGICGYVMAEIELTNQWTGETCSAVGLNSLIANPEFFKWANVLSPTIGTEKE